MLGMDAWEVVCLTIAGYVCLKTLLRLMRSRRDEAVNTLQNQIQTEIKRQREQKKRDKKTQQKVEAEPSAARRRAA